MKKLYRQFRKLKFATSPLLKNIMNHLSSFILIFIFISAILLSPTSYMKVAKWQEFFFATLKMSASDPPTIFFIFICHFATLPLFRVRCFSSFLLSSIPRHFKICHFATFHFHQLVLITNHFFLISTSSFIYIYLFFSSKYIKIYKENEGKNHVWSCFKSMNPINEKHKFKTCTDKA